MNLVVFATACFLAAALSLAARRSDRLSVTIGLIGLLAALLLALAWDTSTPQRVAQESVGGDPFLRLFLVNGLLATLLLTLLGVTVSPPSSAAAAEASAATDRPAGAGLRGLVELPSAALIVFGSAAIALSVTSPMAALLAAVAAGFAAPLGFGLGRASAPLPRIAIGALRNLAVAAAIVIIATSTLVAMADPLGGEPFAVGLAFVGVAGAVFLRLGSIPFHRLVVAPTVNGVSLAVPLLIAWAPIVLVIVAMAVLGAGLPALELPLSMERSVVLAAAAISILLGAAVAAVQDDIHHLVAYSVVAQSGFVLLAVATFDPPPWAAARVWLLVFGLTTTALVGWALALHATIGSARLDDLAGWTRRSPGLAVALVAIVVASLGLPGLAVFDARRELVGDALAGPLGSVVVIGGYVAVVAYARLLWVGFGAPSAAVIAARDWRVRRPVVEPDRPVASASAGPPIAAGSNPNRRLTGSPAGLADRGITSPGARSTDLGRSSRAISRRDPTSTARGGRASETAPATAAIPTRGPDRSARAELARIEVIIRRWVGANVAPAAAALVLGLALLSVLAALGIPNVRQAAAADRPVPLAGSPISGSNPLPSISLQPVASP
ncbi:MAG TPA: proton-conducting transporter membrane subunit [Candidatus Saccharimonadales bacterium]|nr:proton-conducting transporter membrane subunit [Candidatus Saccharimonadales bacterium]